MTNHYLALSTGPLTATLISARKTREAWVASYLFSRLMYHLIQAVENKGGTVLAPRPPTATAHFVQHFAPAPPPNESPLSEGEPLMNQYLFGTGIYPDRLFAYFEELEETQLSVMLSEIKDEAIRDLSTEVLAYHDAQKRLSTAQTTDFYRDYFRIAAVWLPTSEIGAASLILTLNELLDTQELRPAYVLQEQHPDALLALFDRPYSTKLTKDGLVRHPANPYQGQVEAAIKKANGKVYDPGYDLFPSTAQIASVGLYHSDPGSYWLLQDQLGLTLQPAQTSKTSQQDDPDDPTANADGWMNFYRKFDEEDGNQWVQKLQSNYQQYHKYFCIVHADGDRFGKTIEAIGNEHHDITDFSEKLAAFAAEAAGIINAHNGKPIYVGGDDLLFFCPLVTYRHREEDTVTVFDLIKALDDRFKEHSFTGEPTLSYGLTISHYKYPLFEAKDASFSALLRAKKTKWPGKEEVENETAAKDAIAFRFIRHSGSYFDGTLDKDLLDEWNGLFRLGSGAKFLSSFIYKLRELENLFTALPAENVDAVATTVGNFFDEGVHEAHRAKLVRLAKFYVQTLSTPFTNGNDEATPRNNVYALLRLLYFCLPESQTDTFTQNTPEDAATAL